MKSIFSNFYFKTIALLIIVMGTAFGVIQYNHYTELRGSYLNSVQRISQSLSSKISFFYHNVQNIALNSSLKELDANDSSAYFDSLIALYPSYDVIVLTDLEGNLVAANTIGSDGETLNWKKGEDTNFSDSVWFSKVSSKSMSEDYGKKIIGASALDFEMSNTASLLYGRVKYGMHFSSPVRNNSDEVVGYVSSFVNDKWLGRLLDSASVEALRNKKNNLDAFLVNEHNKVMATTTSVDKVDALSELPFEIKTSNFSQNWKKGKWQEGLSSLKTFLEEPFFIVSEFRHQNFLNELGWSLVAKVNKEVALSAMWLNTVWFFASLAVLTLLMFVLKARSQRKFNETLAQTWKSAELSLGHPKERKGAVRILKSVFRSLETLKDASALDLARPPVKLELVQERELDDTKARLEYSMQGQELWAKELGREHDKFGVEIDKARQRIRKSEEEHSLMADTLESLSEIFHNLKLCSLSMNMENSKARELDSLIEKGSKNLKEAIKSSKSLERSRVLTIDELIASWSSRHSRFEEKKDAILEALTTSKELFEWIKAIDDKRFKMEKNWELKWKAFLREYQVGVESVNELKGEIEHIQNIVKNHGTSMGANSSLKFDVKSAPKDSKKRQSKKAA